METKQRILDQALKTFNKSGYGAVNLFELAKSLDMSRGNMTYHFKDKETLLQELTNQLWDKLTNVRMEKSIPSFQNLHNEAQLYYRLQKEYSFIFHDNQMLKHTLIAPKMESLCTKMIKEIETAIAFSIQLGNMRDESVPGVYKNLALTTWMSMFFWSSQKMIRGNKTNEDGEKVIWSLLLPHLTEKGLASFKKFFGEEYLSKMGEAFDHNMDSYLTF
ncbi:TetR/AcrR family transcriptional regulator [Aquimarina sp. 2201CG14-23]|uniref:TetR/AcrR family transcriptional regulator n=1 Tax=Aquimarina mycalae TaxID=3040073 RepID=UPI002477E6CB|nr:TetR/AcrR family transcriptional regulator [Aquimarina sp. 2201CG14-23]MDH7447446.1 TetR/AcrR family transcriptional regulator [Aquimarina sp. 2201CG14-23]